MVAEKFHRIGRILVGVCAASFASNRRFILSQLPSGAEVGSAKPDVLGGNDHRFIRAGGLGSSFESNGTSGSSATDHHGLELWATGVDTDGYLGSPKSSELERNCRDLRDCRSSMDSRRCPRRVPAGSLEDAKCMGQRKVEAIATEEFNRQTGFEIAVCRLRDKDGLNMARFYFVWLVHFGNVLNQLFVFNNVWLQTPQRVFAVVTSRHIAAKFQSATERARK